MPLPMLDKVQALAGEQHALWSAIGLATRDMFLGLRTFNEEEHEARATRLKEIEAALPRAWDDRRRELASLRRPF